MGKLGYSTLTLTDLTETLPVSLVLESNLSRNIQTKIGNLYTPNFNEEGKELIITPSLFIGTEEISIPIKNSEEQDSNYIYYQTGELDENNLSLFLDTIAEAGQSFFTFAEPPRFSLPDSATIPVGNNG